jgi:hypothetical protein
MFIATLKTEHFEFVGAGQSKSQAQRCVVDGFRAHLKSYGSSEQQWCDEVGNGYVVAAFAANLEDWYGINVVELNPGVCLRDGTVV